MLSRGYILFKITVCSKTCGIINFYACFKLLIQFIRDISNHLNHTHWIKTKFIPRCNDKYELMYFWIHNFPAVAQTPLSSVLERFDFLLANIAFLLLLAKWIVIRHTQSIICLVYIKKKTQLEFEQVGFYFWHFQR